MDHHRWIAQHTTHNTAPTQHTRNQVPRMKKQQDCTRQTLQATQHKTRRERNRGQKTTQRPRETSIRFTHKAGNECERSAVCGSANQPRRRRECRAEAQAESRSVAREEGKGLTVFFLLVVHDRLDHAPNRLRERRANSVTMRTRAWTDGCARVQTSSNGS